MDSGAAGDYHSAMLPEGFTWANRHQYDTQETALVFRGRQVAMLLERLCGDWFVRLNSHRGINGPLLLRDCGTLEEGRERLERWAARNAGRLRRELRG